MVLEGWEGGRRVDGNQKKREIESLKEIWSWILCFDD